MPSRAPWVRIPPSPPGRFAALLPLSNQHPTAVASIPLHPTFPPHSHLSFTHGEASGLPLETKDYVSLGLGAWGTVLATALFVFRVAELVFKGPKLGTSFSFSSSPEDGNTVVITNDSNVPAILLHWELVWASAKAASTAERIDEQDGAGPLIVGAYGTERLTFAEADHFDWGPSQRRGRSVFLKVYFARRKKPVMASCLADRPHERPVGRRFSGRIGLFVKIGIPPS